MRSLHSLVASPALQLFLSLLLGAFSTFAQSGVTVSLAPTNVTMAASGSFSSSTAFTAKVTGSTNTAVTWSVKGAPNYGFGGISSAGVYTAPAALPTSVIVTATSVADPTVSVSTTVTVVSPTPIISSVSPKTLTQGANSLTVYGLNWELYTWLTRHRDNRHGLNPTVIKFHKVHYVPGFNQGRFLRDTEPVGRRRDVVYDGEL